MIYAIFQVREAHVESNIVKLSYFCTNIIIKPSYKLGLAKITSVDARVVAKTSDGLFQYSEIHTEALDIETALERAIIIAEGFTKSVEEA